MKKILLAVYVVILFAAAGCSSLDRKNPTDPGAGSNYTGMHYDGSLSDSLQTNISDLAMKGDEVVAIDSASNTVFVYKLDGEVYYIPPMQNVYTSPACIASDGTLIYVTDNDAATDNLNILSVSGSSVSASQKTIAPIVPAQIAANSSYIYAATAGRVYMYDLSTMHNVLSWDGADVAAGTGIFVNISDIKLHSGGQVVVADSSLNRISVFNVSVTSATASVAYKYDLPYAVKGIAVDDNYIYVPSYDGIHKINYYTGAQVLKFADYGEGAGKISSPGPCEVYQGAVFAASGGRIKIFRP